MGAVEISRPRVSDVPPEVSPEGFHSEIVSRYQRRSRTQARLLARLYLEGLASGDFEPVFRALVGETAALSPSSILKLKADWQQEYVAWKKRPLRGRYGYLYESDDRGQSFLKHRREFSEISSIVWVPRS